MRVKELIKEITYDDLLKLSYDLDHGAKHLKKLLESRKKELEKKARVCAVCGKPILYGDNSYSITFGTDDFKKQAYFCALDCLEFFISTLKKSSKKNKP